MFRKRRWGFTLVCLVGLVLTGLATGPFNIDVRFETINGLVARDRVLFDGTCIGHVGKIAYGDTAVFTVKLSIEREFREFLTDYSRFAIVADPDDKDRMAVEVIQTRLGGTPLKKGSTVAGSSKYKVLMEMMQDDAREGIRFLKEEYRRFSNELRSLSESEKIRELQERIARLGEELKKAGKETRDKITAELIPMLEQEIAELREELEEMGREKEVEPVEEALEKIKYI